MKKILCLLLSVLLVLSLCACGKPAETPTEPATEATSEATTQVLYNTKWDGKKNILVDMGIKYRGYASDMTRNIFGSRPSKLYKKVYGLVLEANRRAIAAAKPGMTAKSLDKVARDFLEANGFGKAFGHSLGHGVGLEVHEEPAISHRANTRLEPGMIITIEPGVYLSGNLGVRIEDLVLITENGCEVLSSSAK